MSTSVCTTALDASSPATTTTKGSSNSSINSSSNSNGHTRRNSTSITLGASIATSGFFMKKGSSFPYSWKQRRYAFLCDSPGVNLRIVYYDPKDNSEKGNVPYTVKNVQMRIGSDSHQKVSGYRDGVPMELVIDGDELLDAEDKDDMLVGLRPSTMLTEDLVAPFAPSVESSQRTEERIFTVVFASISDATTFLAALLASVTPGGKRTVSSSHIVSFISKHREFDGLYDLIKEEPSSSSNNSRCNNSSLTGSGRDESTSFVGGSDSSIRGNNINVESRKESTAKNEVRGIEGSITCNNNSNNISIPMEPSVLPVKASIGQFISGEFMKKGSFIKSWNPRRYVLTYCTDADSLADRVKNIYKPVLKRSKLLGYGFKATKNGTTKCVYIDSLDAFADNPSLTCNPPLQPNDIIFGVNDTSTRDYDEILALVQGSPNESIVLWIERYEAPLCNRKNDASSSTGSSKCMLYYLDPSVTVDTALTCLSQARGSLPLDNVVIRSGLGIEQSDSSAASRETVAIDLVCGDRCLEVVFSGVESCAIFLAGISAMVTTTAASNNSNSNSNSNIETFINSKLIVSEANKRSKRMSMVSTDSSSTGPFSKDKDKEESFFSSNSSSSSSSINRRNSATVVDMRWSQAFAHGVQESLNRLFLTLAQTSYLAYFASSVAVNSPSTDALFTASFAANDLAECTRGVFIKKGSQVKNWKLRHFVMHPAPIAKLEYFEMEKGAASKGSIDISEVFLLRVDDFEMLKSRPEWPMKEMGGVFTNPVAIRVHSAKDKVKGSKDKDRDSKRRVGALLLDLVLPSIPAACAFLAGIKHGTLPSKGASSSNKKSATTFVVTYIRTLLTELHSSSIDPLVSPQQQQQDAKLFNEWKVALEVAFPFRKHVDVHEAIHDAITGQLYNEDDDKEDDDGVGSNLKNTNTNNNEVKSSNSSAATVSSSSSSTSPLDNKISEGALSSSSSSSSDFVSSTSASISKTPASSFSSSSSSPSAAINVKLLMDDPAQFTENLLVFIFTDKRGALGTVFLWFLVRFKLQGGWVNTICMLLSGLLMGFLLFSAGKRDKFE